MPLKPFVWLVGLVSWVLWANKHWPGLDQDLIRGVITDGDSDGKE